MRTSYSRRELYALGEPLGDSATYLKADGGYVLGDGGGGSSQPANTTSTQTSTTELPEWARPYAKDVLAKGQALTDVKQNPYQQYTGDRIAGFSPMQQQAMQGAQNMTVAPQTSEATAAATGAGLGGLGVASQANPYGFQNQVGGYMNPYMNQILAPQLAEANRQYDIGATKQQSAATQAGAFGGSREAIMAAENERNRNTGLNQIYGQGLNTAFTNAQNQYNQNLQNQLQGYGLLGNAANSLGQLGQNQYGQQMGINQLQAQYGGQQQALQQQGLTQAYQDFVNQQNYPYKQLGFMSDMIRGLPLGQQSTAQIYQPPGSVAGQIAGLGVGALGLTGLAKTAGFADGGEVKHYAGDGPSVVNSGMNDQNKMARDVTKLTDEQLQGIIQHPSTPAELRAAQEELAIRASEDHGVASIIPPYMSDDIVSAAGGGILAFSKGGNDGEYFQDPMGAPSYSDEGGAKKFFKQDIRKGETYTPNLAGMLFGYNVLPPKEAKQAEATGEPYNAANATRRVDFETPVKTAPAPRVSGGGGGAGSVNPMGDINFKNIMSQVDEYFKDPEAEAANKRMDEMLAKREGKTKEAKDTALYGFLANLGAQITQAASKPGKSPGLRGILQSVSEAGAPAMQYANAAIKDINNLEDVNLRLNLEHQKLKIADRKNDKVAKMSAFQNIRALEIQQGQLAEMSRYHREVAGLQRAKIDASGQNFQKTMATIGSHQMIEAQKLAAKDFADYSKKTQLEQEYGKGPAGQKAYTLDLYRRNMANVGPQLSYLGTVDKD
jgi:hypothetical protein